MSTAIYKKGQGFWTRQMSALGGAVLTLLGAIWFSDLFRSIDWFGLQPIYWRAIAGVIWCAVLGLMLYAFVYIKPRSVDFLVATETEMKKVNWSSRITGSTVVVILLAAGIAGFCRVFVFLLFTAIKSWTPDPTVRNDPCGRLPRRPVIDIHRVIHEHVRRATTAETPATAETAASEVVEPAEERAPGTPRTGHRREKLASGREAASSRPGSRSVTSVSRRTGSDGGGRRAADAPFLAADMPCPPATGSSSRGAQGVERAGRLRVERPGAGGSSGRPPQGGVPGGYRLRFVEMRLEPDGRIPQDVFFLIKETTGVGDFVGTAGRPTPMGPNEVEKMLFDSRKPDEAPQVKMEFVSGDAVTIKEGPFENYEGTVDEVMPDKGLVRVLVTIFGRQAPVELEYWQIAKAEE